MKTLYPARVGNLFRLARAVLVSLSLLFATLVHSQCVEVIGTGTSGLNSKTLNISTPIAEIDYIEVEATYKSSAAFPTSIQFKTNSQTINLGTADTLQPAAKCGAQQVGFYRSKLNPASSVTLNVFNNSTTMWSFVAYVVKKSSACSGKKSIIGNQRYYIYQCTKNIFTSIPTTTKKKKIKVAIPITEMTNDSRVAVLTLTAGNQTVTKTINTYDLGQSLTIQELELTDVPGNITQVQITLQSPSSNGDSYLNNSTVVTYEESQCAELGNKCIEIVGKGATCNTYTTLKIDVPLAEIDYIIVEAIYKGYRPSGVNFITNSQNIYQSGSSAIALNNYSNICYKGIFRQKLNADTLVKLKLCDNSCYMHSFVAYVYRKSSACGGYNQTVDYDNSYYIYQNSKTITTTIPSTSDEKTIEVNIPIAELNNDSRTATFTLSAGSQSTSVTLSTYDLGQSLTIPTLKLEQVPGNVTSYAVTIASPTNNGDSYINGSVLGTWNSACNTFDTSKFCGSKKITIDGNKVCGSTNFTNFPVLIDVSSNSFKAFGDLQSALGYDIAFTNASGQQLPFQIESYNSSTGTFKVWVNVDVLNASSNTVIYMLYGNANITTNPSSTAAFNSNYKAIYHFNDLNDGTANGNNGTNYNTTSATGKIGDGRFFNGYSSYIDVANSASVNITGNKITLSGWVKGPVPNGDDSPFLVKGDYDNSEQYMLGIDGSASTNNVNTRVTTNYGHYRHDQGNIPNNVWTYVTFVYDGSLGSAQKKTYVNGALVASQSACGNLSSTNGNLLIGKRLSSSRWFCGYLDELRISTEAIDECWIKTEYNNQSSPSTFYTITDIKTCSPVPVTLLKFDARMAKENEVLVNWITASELNNDYFDIERNTDQNSTIEKITRVKGNGNSNALLSYTILDDVQHLKGDVIFYRLKQVDFDGTISYSDWAPVNRNKMSTKNINVYPLPAKEYVNIVVSGTQKISIDNFKIISIDGRDVTSAADYIIEENAISIETKNLPNGFYSIQADGKQISIRESFIINK